MKVFFVQADLTGCGYYRSQLPATALKHSGMEVECSIPALDIPDLVESDIVVLQMQINPEWIDVIDEGRVNGCKYVYELDDDIWHMHSGLPDYEKKRGYKDIMIKILTHCDAVITATSKLASQVKPHNQNVYVLPNYIVEPTNKIQQGNHKIRIGFSGSASHLIDFDAALINALKEIKRRYDKVELIFLGWIPVELMGEASFFRFVEPKRYIHFLRDLRFDIGIAPCKDIPFNQSRSNLKYLEYSINRTATVASAVEPYLDIYSDRGILVNNSYKTWLKALDKLVSDDTYREKLANNAYDFVHKNYMLTDKMDEIKNLYETIARDKWQPKITH